MNIQHHPVVSKNPVKIIGFPDPGKKNHQGTNLSARSNSSLQAPSEKAQAQTVTKNGHRRPRRTRGDVGTSINPGHPMSPRLKVNKYLKSDFLWSKIIFQNHISIYSDLNSLISM